MKVFVDVNCLTLRNLICQNCIFQDGKLHFIFSDSLLILWLFSEIALYNV